MPYPKIQPGSSPLVRYEMEFLPASQIMQVPGDVRALFALYHYDSGCQNFNVRYIGYADNQGSNTVRSLLAEQQRLNGRMWSHFSVFELWDHIQRKDEREVDMLFHQVYRRDAQYRRHLSRDRKVDTRENLFVPGQLFQSFIDRISRTSSQIVDYEESRRTGTARSRHPESGML